MKMFLSISFLLGIISTSLSQTVIPILIDSDMTLQLSESPYIATSSVTVSDGATLTIEPGVVVTFDNNIGLTINGKLKAIGGIGDSIRFTTSEAATQWNKISATNAKIEMDFTIIENAKGAISVYYDTLIIKNSRISNITGGDVIAVHYSDSVVIEDNILEGVLPSSKIDAIDCDGVEYCNISRNIFTNFEDDAIDIGTSANNVFINENIVINCDYGISVGENSNAIANRNVVYNSHGGLQTHSGATLTANHNTFYNCNYGIQSYHGGTANSGGIGVINNTIFSKSRLHDIVEQPTSELDVTYSCSDNELIDGEGNVLGDPLFVDTLLKDFHLQEGSICINAGDPSEPLDAQGNFVDMGAYEFEPSTNSVKNILNADVKVFPTIVDKEVTITTSSIQSLSVKISSLKGEILFSQKINSGERINMSHFPKGIYLINIKGDNLNRVVKIVKI